MAFIEGKSMNDTDASGTIAVLHRGEGPNPALGDWLGGLREAYPGQIWVPPRIQGNQIARQRSWAAERMRGHWLLFLDADVVPTADALTRLLARNVAIVSGVYYERFPVLVDGQVVFPVAASLNGEKLFDDDVLPTHGLLPVTSAGAGCLLIRREVFAAIGQPYFRCGQIDPERLGEDSDFCLRAAACGIPTHLDCTVRVGHEVEGVVWPGTDGRRWIQWVGPQDAWEAAPKTLASV